MGRSFLPLAQVGLEGADPAVLGWPIARSGPHTPWQEGGGKNYLWEGRSMLPVQHNHVVSLFLHSYDASAQAEVLQNMLPAEVLLSDHCQ